MRSAFDNTIIGTAPAPWPEKCLFQVPLTLRFATALTLRSALLCRGVPAAGEHTASAFPFQFLPITYNCVLLQLV